MKNLSAVLFVLVYTVFSSMPGEAVMFAPKDFEDLATEAEQIFVGTAVSATARRSLQGSIVTDFVFNDLEVIKGVGPTEEVSVTMWGGTLGSESLVVHGAPKFSIGTRYFLFVKQNRSAIYPVVGGTQGVFQVRFDSSSGVSEVFDYGGRGTSELRDRSGTVLASSAPDSLLASNPKPLSKDQFAAAVRQVLTNKPGR